MESQDTSSQDWLEGIYDGTALPLFLPSDSDDEPSSPRESVAAAGLDSDKENVPPPQVPPLPWPQRRQIAGALTRIAFGHEAISSAMLQLRDIVLGIYDEASDEVIAGTGDGAQGESAVVPDHSDGSRTVTEDEGEDSGALSVKETRDVPLGLGRSQVGGSASSGLAESLAYLLEPGRHSSARSQTLPTSEATRKIQERPGLTTANGSVAAVVVEALNAKRKADCINESSEAAPKRRRVTRRVVPAPTQSQVERQEYIEHDRAERTRLGLPPRKPQRRPVTVRVPSPQPASETQTEEELEGGTTPSTQFIEAMFGYNSTSVLTQSGFTQA